MDTALKISQLGAAMNYPITCIGVPKTVDNDLPHTDCCPGFGSVAKYIAVSTLEGGARCGLDGAHLDQGVRAGSDGSARRLDRRGRRPGRPQARRCAAHHSVSGDRRSTRRAFSSACKQCVSDYGYCVIVVSEGAKPTRTASSSPTPAPATPSATRSSAASRRWWPTWCARRTATSITGRWPTTCSAPRATSPRKVDVEQAYAVGKAAVELRAHGHERGDADHRAPLLQSLSLGRSATCRWPQVANEEKKVPRDFITRRRLRHHRRLPPLPRAADRGRRLPAVPQRPAGLRAHQGRARCGRKLQDRLQGVTVSVQVAAVGCELQPRAVAQRRMVYFAAFLGGAGRAPTSTIVARESCLLCGRILNGCHQLAVAGDRCRRSRRALRRRSR